MTIKRSFSALFPLIFISVKIRELQEANTTGKSPDNPTEPTIYALKHLAVSLYCAIEKLK